MTAAVQAMAVALSEDRSGAKSKPTVGPKIGGPMLREPTFDWDSMEKYAEFRNHSYKLITY